MHKHIKKVSDGKIDIYIYPYYYNNDTNITFSNDEITEILPVIINIITNVIIIIGKKVKITKENYEHIIRSSVLSHNMKHIPLPLLLF